MKNKFLRALVSVGIIGVSSCFAFEKEDNDWIGAYLWGSSVRTKLSNQTLTVEIGKSDKNCSGEIRYPSVVITTEDKEFKLLENLKIYAEKLILNGEECSSSLFYPLSNLSLSESPVLNLFQKSLKNNESISNIIKEKIDKNTPSKGTLSLFKQEFEALNTIRELIRLDFSLNQNYEYELDSFFKFILNSYIFVVPQKEKVIKWFMEGCRKTERPGPRFTAIELAYEDLLDFTTDFISKWKESFGEKEAPLLYEENKPVNYSKQHIESLLYYKRKNELELYNKEEIKSLLTNIGLYRGNEVIFKDFQASYEKINKDFSNLEIKSPLEFDKGDSKDGKLKGLLKEQEKLSLDLMAIYTGYKEYFPKALGTK